LIFAEPGWPEQASIPRRGDGAPVWLDFVLGPMIETHLRGALLLSSGEDAATPLAQWRAERRVRAVAFDGDANGIWLDELRLIMPVVTRDGKVPHSGSSCTAASAQAWEVFSRALPA
jgi:hypothetical protein